MIAPSDTEERILVVDDDSLMLQTLKLRLDDEGYAVRLAPDGYQAVEECRRTPFELIICDVKMPGIDGLETLRRVKEMQPRIKSVLITGFASEDAPVRAIRLGVDDYLYKPFEDEQFIHCVQRVFKELRLENENKELLERLQHQNKRLHTQVKVLKEQEKKQFDFEHIVGASPAMVQLFRQVDRIAPTRSTVLLIGESGTGKELVARALHHASPREKECFMAINCSAISKDLLESELFGHRKGAFTGAESDRRGLLEEASGGTVLLDEIGDMPFELQAKLLRVLENGAIRRIGENTERKIDVRVISATNVDLGRRVEEGGFRQDLFYRLNTVTLRIPPLRDRIEDVELLALHFLERFAQEQGKQIKGFRSETLERMKRHPWKGNVRELRNAVEHALIFSEQEGWIDPHLLPLEFAATPNDAHLHDESRSLGAEVEKYERKLIQEALAATGGKVARAAKLLGISRTNLHNKMAKHCLSSS